MREELDYANTYTGNFSAIALLYVDGGIRT